MAEVNVIVEENFGTLNRNLLEGYATIFGYGPSTPASIALDDIFSQLVRQDFHLVRNYTVTQVSQITLYYLNSKLKNLMQNGQMPLGVRYSWTLLTYSRT